MVGYMTGERKREVYSERGEGGGYGKYYENPKIYYYGLGRMKLRITLLVRLERVMFNTLYKR